MIYLFSHPKTGEIREIEQQANDVHSYTDETGLLWNREFSIPYTSSNTKADPFSSKDFKSRFSGKNVKIGDMWEESASLSDQRSARTGMDPVKEKFFDSYSEKRHGLKHPDDPRPKEAAKAKVQKHLDKMGKTKLKD